MTPPAAAAPTTAAGRARLEDRVPERAQRPPRRRSAAPARASAGAGGPGLVEKLLAARAERARARAVQAAAAPRPKASREQAAAPARPASRREQAAAPSTAKRGRGTAATARPGDRGKQSDAARRKQGRRSAPRDGVVPAGWGVGGLQLGTAGPGVALAPASPLGARLLQGALALPDHRWLDRLMRGRSWIALIGVALLGIVFLQVSLLKLNTGIGRAVQTSGTLEGQNQELRTELSRLGGSERIGVSAGALGYLQPKVGKPRFLDAARADPRRAAEGITQPKPVLQLPLGMISPQDGGTSGLTAEQTAAVTGPAVTATSAAATTPTTSAPAAASPAPSTATSTGTGAASAPSAQTASAPAAGTGAATTSGTASPGAAGTGAASTPTATPSAAPTATAGGTAAP